MIMNSEQNTAIKLGDIIETEVQNPYPHKLVVQLCTQESVDHAIDLVNSGRWKIRSVDQASGSK